MFGFDDVTFALQIDFFMPFQYNRVSARAASRDKCVCFVFFPLRGRVLLRTNNTGVPFIVQLHCSAGRRFLGCVFGVACLEAGVRDLETPPCRQSHEADGEWGVRLKPLVIKPVETNAV